MNYSNMIKYDTGNWSGINSTIFFSGCNFHCPGCFNKEAQSFKYGHTFDKNAYNKFLSYAKDDTVDGICILGGEPFHQNIDELYAFIKNIKKDTNKPIHIWTGYSVAELIFLEDKRILEILKLCDTIVDGRFVEESKDLTLMFRGSSNQNVYKISTNENGVMIFDKMDV